MSSGWPSKVFSKAKEDDCHDRRPNKLICSCLNEYGRSGLGLVRKDDSVQKLVPGVPDRAVDEQPVGAEPQHSQGAEGFACKNASRQDRLA